MNLRDELAAAAITGGSSPDSAYVLADVVIERRSQSEAVPCCNFDPELTFKDDPRPTYELFCHQCRRNVKAATYRLVVEAWNASNP